MIKYGSAVIEYGGDTYAVGTRDGERIWILKMLGETYASDEGFEPYGDNRGKLVPIAELDAWYRDRVTATWRGEPVRVRPLANGKVFVDYVGGDMIWAANSGLDGDQYNGFSGSVDEAELENVRVDRTDYLARWKEKQG